MFIEFEKVILHNFLSYGHAEIDLKNRNYCLVRGINNNPKDNALSNGSGKSTWSSAICWALTGQTIQGIKTNIKNINISENSCYVQLLFKVDNLSFDICRYKEPKSDLTIYVDGKNVSGKGIRESEAILAEYLPDLTLELLSSVIILGQGLPSKFTSNTASGRKEMLEKLSKSDFMIQDIKNRLAKVISDNNVELRKYEDSILAKTSELNVYKNQKTNLNNELVDLEKPCDYSVRISNMENNIAELENLVKRHETLLNEEDNKLKIANGKLNTILTEKSEVLQSEQKDFNDFKSIFESKKLEISSNSKTKLLEVKSNYTSNKATIETDFNVKRSQLSLEINALKEEVSKIEGIRDVCPTCGQRIPNVIKPDTSKQKQRINEINSELTSLDNEKINEINAITLQFNATVEEIQKTTNTDLLSLQSKYDAVELEHKNYQAQIETQYKNQLTEINTEIRNINQKIDLYKADKRLKESKLLQERGNLKSILLEKENREKRLEQVKAQLLSIDNTIEKLENEILYNNNEKELVSIRLDIDNKINTLIKRDFRGFLLSNVINFIDSKIKEYAQLIFGCDQLDFILDGNNIDISYRNKSFENLSGGEKQKVDLIIQFAIRDMMSEYLSFSSNILVLDEIFDNLDSIGCNKLIDLISNKLNDIESLFIISHHSDELQIPFDTEMVVVKDSDDISKVI